MNAARFHVLDRFLNRAVNIDAAAGVFHEIRLETELYRVQSRPINTEIRRKTADKHLVNSPLLQLLGKTCESTSICFNKG